MSDALKDYAVRLRNEVENFSNIIESMKAGKLTSYEVEANSGHRTDTTPERISDFELIVANLKSVIADIERT